MARGRFGITSGNLGVAGMLTLACMHGNILFVFAVFSQAQNAIFSISLTNTPANFGFFYQKSKKLNKFYPGNLLRA
jgi:hypothetical protein